MNWYNPNKDLIRPDKFYVLVSNNNYIGLNIINKYKKDLRVAASNIEALEQKTRTVSLRFYSDNPKIYGTSFKCMRAPDENHIPCKPKDFIKCLEKMIRMKNR